ncbi:MAG: branched-chain amino acid ABC transporter permease [Acidibrevibacterium sp.]|uniref:branched-chain amino acid ABC transporter permease n=1 Tax=Acidibrevibacterium sp. TaxID=2606776 RepID=UPI003CFDF44C
MLATWLVSGLAIGAMYGLLALGYHVTWVVSRSVNFAQGSVMMLGAVITFAMAVTAGWPMPFAMAVALVGCAGFGVVLERVAVRPFRARGSESWLMATVAAGMLVENSAMFLFGKEPRGMPSALARYPLMLFGVGVLPLHIVILIVGLGLAGMFLWATRATRYGKALLAVMQNPRAAQLMGIDAAKVTVFAYALSSTLAGLAGILTAPLTQISADMGFVFGIKGFAAAILGGLDNPWGVVLAGLLLGLAEASVTLFAGSGATVMASFGLVILALYFRPHGLFGRAETRKV